MGYSPWGHKELDTTERVSLTHSKPSGLSWWLGGKEPACQCSRLKRRVRCLGREDPLEEGMVTHSSILAWEIPWTKEPDGL